MDKKINIKVFLAQVDSTPKEIIKFILTRKHITQKSIAENLGVTPAAICRLISGKLTSPNLKRQFAKAIGYKVSELWPERKAA